MVTELIKKLGLQPHPEGGYFKETYRSSDEIMEASLSSVYSGRRSYSTCIYFLLPSDTFSAFHKIHQDEIWHFYLGSPIQLQVISERGKHREFTIGTDLTKGEAPQLIVPGNHWFAASVLEPNSFALVGCTVAPGFDFADFTLARRGELITKFPKHRKLITRLTRA